MEKMTNRFLLPGSVLALLAVAAGAFGAHALRDRLTPDMLSVFETAARYQMYHALALIALDRVGSAGPAASAIKAAGWLFVAGIMVFSGSLYLLVFSGLTWLGAITPIGGLAFMGGWACLAVAAIRARAADSRGTTGVR